MTGMPHAAASTATMLCASWREDTTNAPPPRYTPGQRGVVHAAAERHGVGNPKLAREPLEVGAQRSVADDVQTYTGQRAAGSAEMRAATGAWSLTPVSVPTCTSRGASAGLVGPGVKQLEVDAERRAMQARPRHVACRPGPAVAATQRDRWTPAAGSPES